MKKSFALVPDKYEGITKNAVNILSGTVAPYMGYEVLPVIPYDKMDESLLSERTVIAIGRVDTHPLLSKCAKEGLITVPDKSQGYSVYVGNSPFAEDTEIVLIAGSDEAGVLYGCSDFCANYLGAYAYNGNLFRSGHFDNILAVDLITYSVSTAPAIPTRAIWTWGHMIYDYRGFFENMARLRLNEAVIWNDACPINAKDIVDFAHSLGIKIVWGYTWGWDQQSKLEAVVAESGDELINRIKNKAIAVYENEYKGCGDGIYFQSFTEIFKDSVNGKNVAKEVTRLVNETAGELLARYPDLHIQFGLHATSVKTQTKFIAEVDPRVHIVWEDCGCFPYAYSCKDVEDLDGTLDFTEKLLTLRGKDERFGAVLKGLVCLDWKRFVHFSTPFVLGEHSKEYVLKRAEEKRKVWKAVTAGWLRYTDFARKTVSLIAEKGNEPIIEMLVEDGCFEAKIPLPVALMAELFWSAEESHDALIERVAKYPCVSI